MMSTSTDEQIATDTRNTTQQLSDQILTLTKELEKTKLERDAVIAKVSHEKALIELEGEIARAQTERQKALADLKGQTAIAQAEQQKVLSDLEGQTAIAQAEHQKALVELEKQTAQAQRDAFAARLPTGDVTPLEGDTNLGPNTGHLSELVAYQAIQRTAEKASDDIRQCLKDQTTNPRILIVPTLDLISATASYDLVLAQVNQWQTMLSTQLSANQSCLEAVAPEDTGDAEEKPETPPPIAGVMPAVVPALSAVAPAVGMVGNLMTAVGSFAGAAASVAALFRNDYTVIGRELSIKQEVIQSQLVHALSGFDITIHGFKPETDSDLLDHLQECFQSRGELAKSIALLSSHIEAKPTGIDGNTLEEYKRLVMNATQASNALITEWDKFWVNLITAPDNGPAPLLKALSAEQLRAPEITHYLYVNVVSNGAESQVEKSLWRSGYVTYQGGGLLNYVLADCSGKILAADARSAVSTLTMKLGDQRTGLATNRQNWRTYLVDTKYCSSTEALTGRVVKEISP